MVVWCGIIEDRTCNNLWSHWCLFWTCDFKIKFGEYMHAPKIKTVSRVWENHLSFQNMISSHISTRNHMSAGIMEVHLF